MHNARPRARQHIMSNCWVSWFLWFFLTTGICWHIVKQRITAEWVLLVPSSFKTASCIRAPSRPLVELSSSASSDISLLRRSAIRILRPTPSKSRWILLSPHTSINFLISQSSQFSRLDCEGEGECECECECECEGKCEGEATTSDMVVYV